MTRNFPSGGLGQVEDKMVASPQETVASTDTEAIWWCRFTSHHQQQLNVYAVILQIRPFAVPYLDT